MRIRAQHCVAMFLATGLLAGCGATGGNLQASRATDDATPTTTVKALTLPRHPGPSLSRPSLASLTPSALGSPPSGRIASSGHITVTTASAGTFTIARSDCGVGSSSAFFHFGVPGSGEEARIDISTGYHGAEVYGPGTFGVSASANHARSGWFVDFQSSEDGMLTIDQGARSGKIRFTSQAGTNEVVSAIFAC